MSRRLAFGFIIFCASFIAQLYGQTKTAHILFSSNSHGYVDPCG
jgi:hypothetical protein